MLLKIYMTFFSVEAQRLLFLYLGTLSKRYNRLNGPMIYIIAGFLLHLSLPAENIINLWQIDLEGIKLNLLVLIPLLVLRIVVACLVYILLMFLVDIPIYFRWTFISILITDSVDDQASSILPNICKLLGNSEMDSFRLALDCKRVGEEKNLDLTLLLNSIVCFLFAYNAVYRDKYAFQKVGATTIWLDYDGYDTQFVSTREHREQRINTIWISKEELITILKSLYSPMLVSVIGVIALNSILDKKIAENKEFYNSIYCILSSIASLRSPLTNILLGYRISRLESVVHRGLLVSPNTPLVD